MNKSQNNTTLYVIRHGATDLNLEHRYQGKTDILLSTIGRNQIEKLRQRLETISFDIVLTSSAKRSQETCEFLFTTNTPVIVHPGLTEINFGVWEEHTYHEIQSLYPEQLSKCEQDPFKYSPHDGETYDVVLDRISKMYQQICVNYRGKTVGIVGHAGSLNILLCHLFGIKPLTRWQFHLKPASLSRVVIYPDNQVVMELFNDTCHLKENG